MILTVDIGNTNIKFGVFDNDKLVESFRLSALQGKTSDEYGHSIKNMLSEAKISLSDFDGAIMGSVNPNLNYTIEHMISYYFKVKPMVVGSGIKTGLNIKYDNPKEVGADRIMGCLGAYCHYGAPFILIDFGTATTFNAVNEGGEFLGGAITVGLKTASDALSKSAAKLPKIELVKPQKAIGKNTVANMQSGLINGFIGITEQMVKAFKAEMGVNPRVIATGGLSEIICQSTSIVDIIDRALILKGLYKAYKLNL